MALPLQTNTFWSGKSVLITGHTGFKGSWLSLWLLELGAKVIGFALPPPTNPSLFTLTDLADRMTHVLGDIRHFQEIFTVVKQCQPDIVIHMAAQPIVLSSYEYPIDTYSTNVMGTVHLLEALRQVDSAKAIVNVTTDKCYDNNDAGKPFCETDALGGHDPYSNSKACSELVTRAYRDAYFNGKTTGLASARAGNVIGGGDWAKHRLIPDIIQGCAANETIKIRQPHALRPWQHVFEPLRGYLLLAQHLYNAPKEYAHAWNFGPKETDEKAVKWIADYLVNAWGSEARWITDNSPQQHEAHSLKLDIRLAEKKLGWKPQWDIQVGLEKTIQWYQAYYAKQDMHTVSVNQLNHYLNG